MRARFVVTGLCLLAVLPVAAQMIESFEEVTYPAIRPSSCAGERVQEHAAEGQWSLRVAFTGSETDTWPGLTVTPPPLETVARRILVFDVFNPQSEAVALSWRADDAAGKTHFGGASLAPGAHTRVEVWLSDLANYIDMTQFVRIFPYIRMPRQDYVLFFDHFRIEDFTAQFTRVAYAEIAPPAEPTPAEEALGCEVFARSPLAHTFSNSRPWPGEKTDRLSVFAAQGEVEPAGLSLRTLRPLQRVSIAVSPLTSDTGHAWNGTIELGRLRHLDKRTTYSSKDYIVDVPTYVEAVDSFTDLPAETARTFWLRFRVPADSVPGVYRGEVVLESTLDGSPGKLALPLALTILPYTLPEAHGYLIGEYYRPWAYMTDEEWFAGVTRDLQDMRDHGMTSVGPCFGFDTERVSIQEGVVSLGLDGTTRFEHFLNTYVALGFPAPIIMLADSGQSVAAKAGAWGTPEHDSAYKAFWQAVQAACKDRGWPELIVQPVDEPSWQEQEHKDRNVHLLKLLKEIPGMRTEQDGPGDAYFREEAGPYADMWNYNGGIDPFNEIAEIRKNHLVAFYNNDVESYRPEVDRYAAGFFQKAAGIDGVFNWEYRGGGGDLYDNLDGTSGDWVHYYTPNADSLGGPSVAWEAAREGVDDLKYLLALDAWIEKARSVATAASAVADAEQLRAYAIESLAASPRVRGQAQWAVHMDRAAATGASGQNLDPDAARFVGGALKQPNGWTLRDYQRARWGVAQSISALMRACGENVPELEAAKQETPAVHIPGTIRYPIERAAEASASVNAATVSIPRLTQAPVLDGALDDAAWAEAHRVERFVTNLGGAGLEAQTEAFAGWHGDALYVAIRCHEPNMAGIVANHIEDSEPVYEDDCVELFFDGALSRTQYAQLVFNVRGTQWSRNESGQPWSGRVPAATAKGDAEWRVEAAVPLAAILRGSSAFGLNVCRERRAGAVLELSCWHPTGEVFAVPEKFAQAVLDDAADLALAPPPPLDIVRILFADAFLPSEGVLGMEIEIDPGVASIEGARGTLRLLNGEAQPVAEAALADVQPGRSFVALDIKGLASGPCALEVLLNDGNGVTRASARKPAFVQTGWPQ